MNKPAAALLCLAITASIGIGHGHASEPVKPGGDMPRAEVPTKTWDEPLQLLSGKAPAPPASHVAQRKTERVTVKFAVQLDGTVGPVEVVETTNPVANAWVTEAVRTWRFKPATQGGVARVIWVQQAFTFGF